MCDHGCKCHHESNPFYDKMYKLLELLSPQCPNLMNAQLFPANKQQIGIKFTLKNKKDFEHVLDSAFDLEMTRDLIVEKYKDII